MNPEFRRQITLELTVTRLVLMPAVLLLLAVCVLVIEQDNPVQMLHRGALSIIALLAICVGTFTALSSINTELNERTWDQQRMSTMPPWRMAWGKLLGGPIYAWYGVLLCAAVAITTAALLDSLGRTVQTLLLWVLGAAALHASVMASRLYSMDPSEPVNVRRTWGLVVLLFVLMQLIGSLAFGWTNGPGRHLGTTWWWLHLQPTVLLLFLTTAALLLGLLALWRAMSMQLSVPTTPWAWALGNAAACILLIGLIANASMRALAAITLMALSTYYAASIENQVAQRWRNLLYSIRHNQWRRMWQNMPLWPISWAMALAVLLPACQVWNADAQIPNQLTAFVLMALLHVLRDCGIYLFFALRSNARSPLGMTLLVLFVLGAILPAMLWSTGLAPLFEPLFVPLPALFSGNRIQAPHLPAIAWIGMLVQLLAVGAAITWRFRSTLAVPAARA